MFRRILCYMAVLVWIPTLAVTGQSYSLVQEVTHTRALARGTVVRQQIQEYKTILHRLSSEPPIRATVSDSVLTVIATAIHKDSRLTGIAPEKYMALLRMENPALRYRVVNHYGAVGLTQVVPRYWANAFPECGDKLHTDIYTQICYGMRVFLFYRANSPSETVAWWKYNGCTQARRRAAEWCVNYPTYLANFEAEYAE